MTRQAIKPQLRAAETRLSGSPSARLDAEILLAHVLDCPRSFLYAHPELEVPKRRLQQFQKLVESRAGGTPIAYLKGRREFWSLPLKVGPEVLIPRPETELLVGQALQRIPAGTGWRVADLGTGSGAVALALASERPDCEIWAVDTSAEALNTAAANARELKLSNLKFVRSDWYGALTGRFHMLISNPPYVASDDPHLQWGDCRFEPRIALTPGDDALASIRVITAKAPDFLEPAGWLLLEHGFDQGAAVRKLLSQAGLNDIETVCDLEGRDRVGLGRLS